MPRSRRIVIGIGNLDRGDDAVGVLVARHVRASGVTGITVLEQSGEATHLIQTLSGCDAAFIADAADFGAPPGTVHAFDAARESVPSALNAQSTHGFGLAHAIELARALESLPATCRVYAVQIASCDIGRALSPAVAHAVPIVASQIRQASYTLCTDASAESRSQRRAGVPQPRPWGE